MNNLKLDILIEKLDRIEEQLDKIENDIKVLKKGNEQLDDHITFIENVYDTIKSPFYYILNKVSYIDKIPNKQKKIENQNQNEPFNINNMPNVEQLQEHINSMMGGKLGKLTLELAEETAKSLNLDMENTSEAKDVFEKLFKNPDKMMKMVKSIGNKLDDKLKSGELLIAPVETEIDFSADGQVISRNIKWDGPYSPSIDQVLANVGRRFGKKSIAIIFSGMGSDGSISGPQMVEAGGAVWAQDEKTCACPSQPDAMRATGCVSFSGTPFDLANRLVSYISRNLQLSMA